MRFFIFFNILFFSFLFQNIQAQTYNWAKTIGGTDSDQDGATAVDAAGNVYTTGGFRGTVDFDPGTGTTIFTSIGLEDFFITKSDASGNLIWVRRIGDASSSQTQGNAIAIDAAGNLYMTGAFGGTVDFDPGAGVENLTGIASNNIFILKLDASGNYIWAKSFIPTSAASSEAITVDAAGNVYTTGAFQNTVDFDPDVVGVVNLTAIGSLDIFVSKLDAAGNYVWAKSMGGTSFDGGNAIIVDATGNVYTTGYFNGTADFDPDGVGVANLTSNGAADIFVSKLDASGNYVWAKNMGGTVSDISNAITLDVAGNVYTTGRFQNTVDFDPNGGPENLTSAGSEDIFVSKLDAAGNYVWAKRIGGTGQDEGLAITLDATGNVYTTGFFNGTADFDPDGVGVANLTSNGSQDIFVSKLDAAGDYVWAKSMGGTGQDRGTTIIVDAAENVYTTGYFENTVDFDPNAGIVNFTSNGARDIFVSKLSPFTISKTSFPAFNKIFNASNVSTTESFTVSGSDLIDNIELSLSTTDWELSTDNITYSPTLTLDQSGGTLIGQPVTVYIRLKAGISAGSKNATLSLSTAGITQNITLNALVDKATQNITFDIPDIISLSTNSVLLQAETNSGLPITYTSSNTSVAEVSGNTLILKNLGNTTITASQTGDNNYLLANNTTEDLIVSINPPSNLSSFIDENDPRVIGCSWEDNTEREIAYEVWYALNSDDDEDFTRVGLLPPDSTTFRMPAQSPSRTHVFKVRALAPDSLPSLWANNFAIAVTSYTLGLESASESDLIEVYPNPVSDILEINVNTHQPVRIWVYDVNGKLMDSRDVQGGRDVRLYVSTPLYVSTTTWDMTNYPTGQYIFVFQIGEAWYQEKVLKE